MPPLADPRRALALTLLALFDLGAAACTPRRAAGGRPLPPAEPSTDAAPDARTIDGGPTAGAPFVPRCPVRGSPPQTISLNHPTDDPVAVGWNGRDWGVAWTEGPDPEPVTYFARVGADGVRRGAPVRVSEPGYRGGAPSLAWTGENWVIAYAGGAGRLDELWVARIDARGIQQGRPERLTARDRNDGAPSLAFNGRDLLAAWSARLWNNRHAVYALRLSRYGGQIDTPVLLGLREIEHISNATVVWNGTNWGIGWLVSRLEPVAVDMRRLEPDASRPYHDAVRVTAGALGGTGSGGNARYALAWDGTEYGMVWDEVLDGAPRVFFSTISLRLNVLVPRVMLSDQTERATAPAMAAVGDGEFIAAWETERGGGTRHVVVGALDAAGHSLGERVGVQGPDGVATRPSLAVGDSAVGVGVVGGRGVSFTIVALGPCAAQSVGADAGTARRENAAAPGGHPSPSR